MLATQLYLKCFNSYTHIYIIFGGYAGSSSLCRLLPAAPRRDTLWLQCSGLPCVEHRLQVCVLQQRLLGGMRDLFTPGCEPLSPALVGRCSTTGIQGKPLTVYLIIFLLDFSSGMLRSELMSLTTAILYPFLWLCTKWLAKSIEPWCKAKDKDRSPHSLLAPGHLPFCCTSCRASAAYLVALGVLESWYQRTPRKELNTFITQLLGVHQQTEKRVPLKILMRLSSTRPWIQDSYIFSTENSYHCKFRNVHIKRK